MSKFIGMPFLSDLDTRATIRGSRDPLGIQAIWTRLGRNVVGNLTTVSNSICDFKSMLLGYYFVNRVLELDDHETALSVFLKWEQLAGSARGSINDDWVFRGTERVRKFLDEGAKVTLSSNQAHQILSNQKIYGLWGLYSMPSRASGLLAHGSVQLTPDALEFVESCYIQSIFNKDGIHNGLQIIELLKEPTARVDISGKEKRVANAVATALRKKLRNTEIAFFKRHLLDGGPNDSTKGLQGELARHLSLTLSNDNFEWSPNEIVGLAKEASLQGELGGRLAFHLKRIHTCESVMAPISMLFTHMLGMNDLKIDVLIKRLKDSWGPKLKTININSFSELRDEINVASPETAQRWIRIAESAATGQYKELITELSEQNKCVMAGRGGAPWIEISDKFDIRFREESGELPSQDELPKIWRFPYFMDSLRTVLIELN